MASGLDADEKRSGLDAKQAGTPLPLFCVSAHSRRLRPFILWLSVPASFLGERGRDAGGFQGREAAFAKKLRQGPFATESIRNQGTRACAGDAAPSWRWSQKDPVDPSGAPRCAQTGARWGPGHRSGRQRGQGMDRGDRQNRDRKRKHAGYYPERKMRSTSIYSMVYSNNRRGECLRNRSNDALGTRGQARRQGQSVY
jgi:hypothetical protein